MGEPPSKYFDLIVLRKSFGVTINPTDRCIIHMSQRAPMRHVLSCDRYEEDFLLYVALDRDSIVSRQIPILKDVFE